MTIVREQEDGSEDQRVGIRDRRQQSALSDPRFWVSCCAVLLTFSIFAFTFMYSRFSEMLAAQQAMLVSITRQDAEQKAVVERIAKLENQVAIQQQAYNYNISNRLAVVEAKNGIQPQR